MLMLGGHEPHSAERVLSWGVVSQVFDEKSPANSQRSNLDPAAAILIVCILPSRFSILPHVAVRKVLLDLAASDAGEEESYLRDHR